MSYLESDVLYDPHFILMIKRFEENIHYFKRFVEKKCIGKHAFKRDGYVFEFFNTLGFTTDFTITYIDRHTDYQITLEPVFKENDFSNDSYYFSSLFILDRHLNRIDHLYIFRLGSEIIALDDFFSQVIRNYSFSSDEFHNLILHFRPRFNAEEFELLRYIFNSQFYFFKSYKLTDFNKMKNAIARFLFLDKQNNHSFLNTEINRFIKKNI